MAVSTARNRKQAETEANLRRQSRLAPHDAETTAPTDESAAATSTAWTIAGFPGEIKAAAYLVGELAAQYRLIVDILDEQREYALTGVGHDELATLLREKLPPELYGQIDLDSRMNQLVAWGTCNRMQDEALTQADFLRNRYRYQLTTLGYEINQATKRASAQIDDASTSATVAPENIVNTLGEVIAALEANHPDEAANKLAIIHDIVQNMRQAAATWQSRLAASISEPPSEESVRQQLATILAYADRWGVGVDAYSEAIAGMLPFFHELPSDTWRRLALSRVGAQAEAAQVEADVEGLHRIIDILAHWFTGLEPQSRRLRRQIRDAVTPMLQGQRALLSVGGVVSRKNDLLRLASTLEQASDDAQAWEIWCAATGLFTARHVADRTPEDSDPWHQSVWESEPVQINQRLRKRGPRTLSGRPPRMADRSLARRAAQEHARRDQLHTERAIAALRARSGTELAAWGELDETEAEILLDMLAAAQASAWPPFHEVPTAKHPRHLSALSSDGKWRLHFTPLPGPAAVVRTGEGRLVIPNFLVEFAS